MSSAMKCYLLLDASPKHPPFDCLIGAAWRMDVGKRVVVWLAPLSEKFCRLWRYIKIFLSFRFFLLKDNSHIFSLLLYLTPCKIDDVASAQSCKAGEKKSPFDIRIFAFRLCELFHLLNCQVHSFSLLRLDALYAPHRIVRNDALLVCLIKTRFQLSEIACL